MSNSNTAAGPAGPLGPMLGRPFGVDEAGRTIDHGAGKLIVGAINWMLTCVERAARESAPSGESPAELDARAEGARRAALDSLVAMLNEAIGDRRYHVSADYLLNENNRYSYEFRLFVSEYCRVLSGDDDFLLHAGQRSIPEALALLGKPLGLQRTYALLPRFAGKLVKTDLRVVSTAPGSAVIQWRGQDQVALVPAPHRDAYIRYACGTYRGAFSAVPQALFGLPLAKVEELSCQADGAECCEWQFTWEPMAAGRPRATLAAGGALSALLITSVAAVSPVQRLLALAGAATPLVAAWQRNRMHSLGFERDQLRQQLLEERDLAEAEYDRSDRATSDLQVLNMQLAGRVAELTALHETATALSGTLDLDEVLDRALNAVVAHLAYDRAMVLLADEQHGVLAGGRAVGGTAEMAERISQLSLPLDFDVSPLVRAFHASGPMAFSDVHEDPDEGNRAFALALGVTAFMTVPLTANGRRLGVLAVDNGVSHRPLDAAAGPLLMTLASQVAVAVEKAWLHAQLEAHNRSLEARVLERTAELERTTRDLERELAERRALRDRELQYLDEVNRVVGAAAAVEGGTFDPASLRDTAARTDELGQLARTFSRMAGHVQERERQLEAEVQTLRIEIDEARQAKQVAAIIDTEYFQALRNQAKELRQLVADV